MGLIQREKRKTSIGPTILSNIRRPDCWTNIYLYILSIEKLILFQKLLTNFVFDKHWLSFIKFLNKFKNNYLNLLEFIFSFIFPVNYNLTELNHEWLILKITILTHFNNLKLNFA